MRQRRDEAQPSAGLGDFDIARGTAGAIGKVTQSIVLRNLVAHLRQRQVLVEPVRLDGAHRHDLDQGEIHAPRMRPGDHRHDLVFVDALQRDHVDLDVEAGRLRRIDTGENPAEIAAPCDRVEFLRVAAVERDIDAAHATGCQLRREEGKTRTVGRQRQLVERAGIEMPGEALEQPHDIAPDQRLATGKPQLACAAGDEGAAEPVQFLEREQVAFRQKAHIFRHAIDAAEVAAVGHRNPQIGDRAAEGIDERPRSRLAFRCRLGWP